MSMTRQSRAAVIRRTLRPQVSQLCEGVLELRQGFHHVENLVLQVRCQIKEFVNPTARAVVDDLGRKQMQFEKITANFRWPMMLIVAQLTAERIYLVNGVEQPERVSKLSYSVRHSSSVIGSLHRMQQRSGFGPCLCDA
jgi:hypothetical protein